MFDSIHQAKSYIQYSDIICVCLFTKYYRIITCTLVCIIVFHFYNNIKYFLIFMTARAIDVIFAQ